MKLAIAGASGNVAQEVLDALVGIQKHEIVLLSRKTKPNVEIESNVSWLQVDYDNAAGLIEALRGIHTVLCFITPQSDPANASQKALIDAAIKAGVKRFAPSEWTSASFVHMPWYAGKEEIREYLAQINEHETLIEYCLFQPGLFVNYFASPYKTSQHLHPFQTHIDFDNRRAIVLFGSGNARLSLITVKDFCNILLKAIDHEGTWPVIGGISGDTITIKELLAVGGKIRTHPGVNFRGNNSLIALGGPFKVETVTAGDAMAGIVNSSWLPQVDHPAVPADQVKQLSEGFTAGMLLAFSAGAFEVSDEWNKLFPEYEFTRAADFLSEVWEGKR